MREMKAPESQRFREFYRAKSGVYHQRRYETPYGVAFCALHHELVEEFLDVGGASQRVLEIACGTGHVTSVIGARVEDPVVCDLTPEMLIRAQQRVADGGGSCCFVLSDAQRLPFGSGMFDAVLSTRFLHLFPLREQETLLGEMARVLRRGGRLFVDFDNWSSRWLFTLPYLVYNLLRYRRLAPYSIYNRIRETVALLDRCGLHVEKVLGVGGTHLVLPALLSTELAVRLGRWHRHPPWRLLAEQFAVIAMKR